MTSLFAKRAYLEARWHEQVRITIDDGKITCWDASTSPLPSDELFDIIIPGVPNAHSHVFQRALAGHCERKSPSDRDDFWSWRSNMYKLAEKLNPDSLKPIARQAFSEMLAAGYTSVAEFHYIHHSGDRMHGANNMFDAIVEAAQDVGIRLTYLPILYERAGFGRSNLNTTQQLFALNLDDLFDHFSYANAQADSSMSVGLGVHSLRAVSESSLKQVVNLAKNEECPMHIHIAEQTGEVDECIATHGAKPVRWLLDNFEVEDNWCLVHATHSDEKELASLSSTSAVICLCPTTEANLGDGIFPMKVWKTLEGGIAIGSDSQISINPFEELRWLEYGHRLVLRSRNIYAKKPSTYTGETLFQDAVLGGNRACGHWRTPLAPGSNADLITINEDSPILAGHKSDSVLDALTFCGIHNAIDRVMVSGQWVVKEGRHVTSSKLEEEYAECVNRLWN
ncbi:MAG: formimidoylglutamate deiminase [Gammaproteobacteria bacterium]|nr:formimidoylglutamate deiminase [Gammaproteobacteria bacterium]